MTSLPIPEALGPDALAKLSLGSPKTVATGFEMPVYLTAPADDPRLWLRSSRADAYRRLEDAPKGGQDQAMV